MEQLTLKYRPKSFDEVVGHEHAVTALRQTLSDGSARSFIFAGPSGIGKTTFARIIANELNCDPFNVKEIDAATHTGIDAMREVTESLQYSTFGTNQSRVILVDECHALSKAAWQSLLKIVEEPPANVYWCFLTTEPDKIPETIKTRCQVYALKPLSDDDLFNLLIDICEKESITPEDGKAFEGVLDLCVRRADGSPRRAIMALSKASKCADRKEAAGLLDVLEDDDSADIKELCKILYKPGLTWKKAMGVLTKLKGIHPETIRLQVAAYYQASLLGAATDGQSEKSIVQSLQILQAFGEPYKVGSTTNMLYPVILSVGEVIYGGEHEAG